MPATKTAAKKRTLYDALDNECRLDIIAHLARGEQSVTKLARVVDAPQAVVSGHLKKLSEAGFVIAKQRGKFRFYALNEEFAAPFLAAFDAGWAPRSGTGPLLRSIVAQLPVRLAATDLRGTIIVAAGKAFKKFDAPLAQVAGRSLFDAFDDRKAAIINLSAAFRGEKVRWQASSGGEPLQLVSMPYKDARGKAAGVITIGSDDAPDAPKHLAEEGEWKSLAEGAAVTITQLGPDGTIQAVNRSLRYPGVDFVGKNIWDLLKEPYLSRARKAIETTLRSGTMTAYEVTASDPGRPDSHFECRVMPYWIQGAIAGVTVTSLEVPGPSAQGR